MNENALKETVAHFRLAFFLDFRAGQLINALQASPAELPVKVIIVY